MNFQLALGFLCLYIGLTASQEPECVYTYVGDSYKIILNSPQQDGDTLLWKCDDKIIYQRRRGKVDPAAIVDVQGSLTLTNISKSMACTYKAEHHNKNGKLIKVHSESICVFSRIPDPKLEVECSPSGVVTLQCGPKNLPEGITLTWFHNDTEMKNEKSNPLKPLRPGVKDRYKCSLSNSHDTEDSKEETVSCEVPARTPEPKEVEYSSARTPDPKEVKYSSGSDTSDNKLICFTILAVVGFLLLV
ncbi:uncharacterized protein LOC134070829 isoform X3 [Sardina pilchardus]|uniref:uncharacterized protein LOC134070829 isoform X3 n=1 Tax=Sardina pilchardus TaxID=27697 RepID=UPI002E1431AB